MSMLRSHIQKRTWTGALMIIGFASALLLSWRVAVNKDENATNSIAVDSVLGLLEAEFNIKWPERRVSQRLVSSSYRAVFDNSSINTSVVARIEISGEDFENWRSSVTNRLTEYEWSYIPINTQLSKKHVWWNPQSYVKSRIADYAVHIEQLPNHMAHLVVHVVETNGHAILFLNAYIMHR